MHLKEKLADYVVETLYFYNIFKQLLAITANNVKNNDTLCQQLQKVLRKESI